TAAPSSAPSVPFAGVIAGELGPLERDVFALPCFAGDRLELRLFDLGRLQGAHGAVAAELLDGRGDPVPLCGGRALGLGRALIVRDETLFLSLTSGAGVPAPCAHEARWPYAFELLLETARFEEEQGDASTEATGFGADTRVAGCIALPGDVDRFSFEARAGLPVLLECFADDEFGSPGFRELDGDGSDLD